MVNEKMVYECRCDKCSHQWVTKDSNIPKVCSKCKSVKWNSGENFSIKRLSNEKKVKSEFILTKKDIGNDEDYKETVVDYGFDAGS